MDPKKPSKQQNAFTTLRQFIRERAPVEKCEMCGSELGSDHRHLFESSSRQLVCTCDKCIILFGDQMGTKFQKVPKRILHLPGFSMTDEQWEGLMIPVNIAFFFYSSSEGRVMVFYPGPAGATESLLTLGAWQEIEAQNSILKEMEPDVEAILVNRVGKAREYYLVPVDECYKLVGTIRLHWKGLSGGLEVWNEIGKFFVRLRERSDDTTHRTLRLGGGSHA